MNKVVRFCVLLSFGFFAIDSISAHHITMIDPIMDFRTPQSLSEMMHEGLLDAKNLLERHVRGGQSEILMELDGIFNGLLREYRNLVDTSKLHTLHRGDREYLQNLIDRIDSMLAALGAEDLPEQDRGMLSTDREVLQELRDSLV